MTRARRARSEAVTERVPAEPSQPPASDTVLRQSAPELRLLFFGVSLLLSREENALLDLAARGFDTEEIAELTGMSMRAARRTIASILRKTNEPRLASLRRRFKSA